METNREFFNTKFFNFVRFCNQNLATQKHVMLLAKINSMCDYKPEEILTYFKTVVQPMGAEAYINKILAECKLTKEDLPQNHMDMLQKYIACFVDIVSQ
jgi:hypothetical protein